MYTLSYVRGDAENTTTFSDFRVACISAYNLVNTLGCSVAAVTDAETGELLRLYGED